MDRHETEATYRAKMREWTDNRLAWEVSYTGGDSWQTDADAKLWDRCMADEYARRNGLYSDGEVLGIDEDGKLILWDGTEGIRYNCGETLEGYGADNLTEVERGRLGLTAEHST